MNECTYILHELCIREHEKLVERVSQSRLALDGFAGRGFDVGHEISSPIAKLYREIPEEI